MMWRAPLCSALVFFGVFALLAQVVVAVEKVKSILIVLEGTIPDPAAKIGEEIRNASTKTRRARLPRSN